MSTDTSNYKACIDLAYCKSGMAVSEYGTMMGEIFKKEAIKYYLKAISLEETSEAYYGLAMLYKDFREYKKAIPYYELAIAINPTSYKIYNDMGYCYYQMEDDKKALECFKKSYEINQNPMVLRNMGNCYLNMGKIEQSNDCYQTAYRLEEMPF